MSNLKDNLILKEEGLKLSLAETGFSFLGFLRSYPRGKRILLTVVAIALVPSIILVRVGSQLWEQHQLRNNLVTAHPSFVNAKAPTIGNVKLFNSGHGYYSAYAQISNENLDLAAASVPYHFDFYNASNQLVTSNSGILFLLPNQKKYIVAPRVDTKESLSSSKLVLGEIQWQKRLTIPEVSLKAAAPFLSNELNPVTLVVEGAVVNNSPYEIASVRLVFLLYDFKNQVVAVSQRDEFSLPAFGRRAYKQTWPDFYASDISRVDVLPDTNSLDANNLMPGK